MCPPAVAPKFSFGAYCGQVCIDDADDDDVVAAAARSNIINFFQH